MIPDEMNESEFHDMVTPANRYEEQLTEDYKEQLRGMKVKRLSPVSFLYYSLDDKLQIRETWNNDGSSTCEVVNY